MRTNRVIVIIGALALALAGCGGQAATPSGADGGGQTNRPTTGAASMVPAVTQEPDDGETGGSGGAMNACLNTVDEVSAAFDVTVTEAENTAAGEGASCVYHIDKAAFSSALAITLTVGELGVDIARQSFLEADGFEEVEGIGDAAGWFAPGGLFVIVKGDRFVTMAAGAGATTDPAVARAALEELARLGADDL